MCCWIEVASFIVCCLSCSLVVVAPPLIDPLTCSFRVSHFHKHQQVFVNGVWVGIHRNPIELVRTLRSLRRAVSEGPGWCVVEVGGGTEVRVGSEASSLYVDSNAFHNDIHLTF